MMNNIDYYDDDNLDRIYYCYMLNSYLVYLVCYTLVVVVHHLDRLDLVHLIDYHVHSIWYDLVLLEHSYNC